MKHLVHLFLFLAAQPDLYGHLGPNLHSVAMDYMVAEALNEEGF